MNNNVEIIFGDSLNCTMKKSKLNKNQIIKFNTLFSVANLSKIKEYKIVLPIEIYKEEIIIDFSKEMNRIEEAIKNNKKIRVWTSHQDADSYILLSYIANFIKDKNYDLYVVYSDKYNTEITSPAMMLEDELETISNDFEKLSKEDINNLSLLWNKVLNNKCDIRIMDNKTIKLVSYDYFNDELIEKLKESKEEKIISLTATMLSKYHLSDTIFIYLIERLINKNKIVITKKDDNICRCMIKVNDGE